MEAFRRGEGISYYTNTGSAQNAGYSGSATPQRSSFTQDGTKDHSGAFIPAD